MTKTDRRVQWLLDSDLFLRARHDGWYQGEGIGFSFDSVTAVEELDDGTTRVILETGHELMVDEDADELSFLASARQSTENEWERARLQTMDVREPGRPSA